MLKQQIDADLKTALLGGDKDRATVLRGLKSTILYAEVEQKVRDTGLDDEAIQTLMAKEAKKRQESADIYAKAGESERAEKELSEKAIIEQYLPRQLSDEELQVVVDEEIAAAGADAHMGKVIGAVKSKVGSQADGGRIAAAVKAKLS